jgi:hypothetical protein
VRARPRNILAVLLCLILVGAACHRERRVAAPPIYYSPSAYGELVGGQGRCYYLDDPFEVRQLQAAGLCPSTWIPVAAPGYWRDRYADFHATPFYVSRFVLPEHRQAFGSAQNRYLTDRAPQIAAERTKATYLGSNGKMVTADRIAKAVTGGGARNIIGGGDRISAVDPTTGMVKTVPAPKDPAPAKPPAGSNTKPGGQRQGPEQPTGGNTKPGGQREGPKPPAVRPPPVRVPPPPVRVPPPPRAPVKVGK